MSPTNLKSPTLYDYVDYQRYLLDFYHYQKEINPCYSYQVIATRLGIDKSLVIRIFNGQRHISSKNINAFVDLLGLQNREIIYFKELLAYCKAEKDKDIQLHMETLLTLTPAKQRLLRASEYEYFQQWHYAAVRSLLEFYHFTDNYKELAQTLKPRITVPQAREAIALLEKLNLIEPLPSGRYVPTAHHITTGKRWRSLAINKYQEETIALSHQGLQRHSSKTTDYSTITMSMNRESLSEIRAILKESRQKIIKLVNNIAEEDIDTLYQLNMQVFPLIDMENEQ